MHCHTITVVGSIAMLQHWEPYLGNTTHTSKEAADSSPPRRFGMAMNKFRVVCITVQVKLRLKSMQIATVALQVASPMAVCS